MDHSNFLSSKSSQPNIVNEEQGSRTPSLSKAFSKFTSETFHRRKKSVTTTLTNSSQPVLPSQFEDEELPSKHLPADQESPILLISPRSLPRFNSLSRKATFPSSSHPTTPHSSSGKSLSRKLSSAVLKAPFLSRFSNITAPVEPSVPSPSQTSKQRGPSINIPEHKLMAPIPPPLPRSKTFGALPNDEDLPLLPKAPSYARGTSSSLAKSRGKSPMTANTPVPGPSRKSRPSHVGSAASALSNRKTPRSSLLNTLASSPLGIATSSDLGNPNSSRVSLTAHTPVIRSTESRRPNNAESSTSAPSSRKTPHAITPNTQVSSATNTLDSPRNSFATAVRQSRGTEGRLPSFAENAISGSSSRKTQTSFIPSSLGSPHGSISTTSPAVQSTKDRGPSHAESVTSSSSDRMTPYTAVRKAPNSFALDGAASSVLKDPKSFVSSNPTFSVLNDSTSFVLKKPHLSTLDTATSSDLSDPTYRRVNRTAVTPPITGIEDRCLSYVKSSASTPYIRKIPTSSVLDTTNSLDLRNPNGSSPNVTNLSPLNDADLSRIQPIRGTEYQRPSHVESTFSAPGYMKLHSYALSKSNSVTRNALTSSIQGNPNSSTSSSPNASHVSLMDVEPPIQGKTRRPSHAARRAATPTPVMGNLRHPNSRYSDGGSAFSSDYTASYTLRRSNPNFSSPNTASRKPSMEGMTQNSSGRTTLYSLARRSPSLPSLDIAPAKGRENRQTLSGSKTPTSSYYPVRKASYGSVQAKMNPQSNIPDGIDLPPRALTYGNSRLPVYMDSRSPTTEMADEDIPPVPPLPPQYQRQPRRSFGDWYNQCTDSPAPTLKQPQGEHSDNDIGPPVPPKSPDNSKAEKGVVSEPDYSHPKYVSSFYSRPSLHP